MTSRVYADPICQLCKRNTMADEYGIDSPQNCGLSENFPCYCWCCKSCWEYMRIYNGGKCCICEIDISEWLDHHYNSDDEDDDEVEDN